MSELINKTSFDPVQAGSITETKTAAAPDALVDSSSEKSVGSSGSSGGQVISAPNQKFPFNLPDKLGLFLSPKGVAYVTIQTDGNPLAVSVGSKRLNNIIRRFAMSEGVSVSKFDISNVNDFLIAHAEMAGIIRPVWYRVAPHSDGIEIDVGDTACTRIIVTPGKVEILQRGSQTLFCRTAITSPMRIPADKGNLELLKKYLNISDSDRLLFIAWLSYTLAHPKVATSKYLILVIQGENGSGKSFFCNGIVFPLIDPNQIGTQVFPGNPKDLAIASQHSHVLCFDNMRNFRAAMADILCMAATGGAISNRALYTDSDQHVHFMHVALVLNGIHSFINQADLAQRCLPIRTLTMSESHRKSETAMLKDLEDDLPVIFRGLLDLIAHIYQHLPGTVISHPERMLDFVYWLSAMERAMGLPDASLQMAYSGALRQAQLDSLMDNTLAAALMEFCGNLKTPEWTGTPFKLLSELNQIVPSGTTHSREWPENAIALSKRLNALKASLITQGISIELGRGKDRYVIIKKLGEKNDK